MGICQVNISDYWREKTEVLSNNNEIFNEWDENEEITIWKMVVMEIMSIPADGLAYYLSRDSWLKDFSLGDAETVECNKLVEDRYLEKRKEVIEGYFYKRDYEHLVSGLLSEYRKHEVKCIEDVIRLLERADSL